MPATPQILSTGSTADLQSAFRNAMRRFASSAAVIALRDGKLRGMTATALVSVTMDPPTILICVKQSASIHEHLRESQLMSVNLLSVDQVRVADAFAGKVAPDERFAHGRWMEHDGVPYLQGAQANIICKIVALTAVGSHTMILAEAGAVAVVDAVTPLVYCDGKYRSLGFLPDEQ